MKASNHIVPWQVLTIGLPKGNLNRPLPKSGNDNDKNHYRGHVRELFRLAYIDIKGYEPGNEDTRPTVPGIESRIQFKTAKPQELERMLKDGDVDMAIVGKDSHEEWISGFWECASRLIPQEEGIEDELNFLQSRNCDYAFHFTDKLLERLINGEVKREESEPLFGPIPKDYWERFDRFIQKRAAHWKKLDNLSRILAAGVVIPDKMLSGGVIKLDEFLKRADECSKILSAGETVFDDFGKNPAVYRHDESLEAVDLGLGKTRIAWATPHAQYCSERFIDSELPWITLRELSKVMPRQLILLLIPPHDFVETQHSIDASLDKISLASMASNTELSHYLSVHCVASGRSLKNNGLVEIGKPLVESTARLYLSPHIGFYYRHADNPIGAGLHALADPLIQRLKDAAIEYGKKYNDSIWHPNGRPAEAAK